MAFVGTSFGSIQPEWSVRIFQQLWGFFTSSTAVANLPSPNAASTESRGVALRSKLQHGWIIWVVRFLRAVRSRELTYLTPGEKEHWLSSKVPNGMGFMYSYPWIFFFLCSYFVRFSHPQFRIKKILLTYQPTPCNGSDLLVVLCIHQISCLWSNLGEFPGYQSSHNNNEVKRGWITHWHHI